MQRLATCLSLVSLFALPLPAQHKEQERLKECATVLGEILNIPDNIPKDLLNKSECVIIYPSVMKVAIGIGGSYGRSRVGSGITDGAWRSAMMAQAHTIPCEVSPHA